MCVHYHCIIRYTVHIIEYLTVTYLLEGSYAATAIKIIENAKQVLEAKINEM